MMMMVWTNVALQLCEHPPPSVMEPVVGKAGKPNEKSCTISTKDNKCVALFTPPEPTSQNQTHDNDMMVWTSVALQLCEHPPPSK
jgi:hypothetical protein